MPSGLKKSRVMLPTLWTCAKARPSREVGAEFAQATGWARHLLRHLRHLALLVPAREASASISPIPHDGHDFWLWGVGGLALAGWAAVKPRQNKSSVLHGA